MPCLPAFADRIQRVDMGTRQTSRMRTGKALGANTSNIAARDGRAFGLAQPDTGQTGQHFQAVLEIRSAGLQNHSRVSGQRVGIDGGYEDGAGSCVYRRHLAVRAGPQRSPQTGADELVTYCRWIEPFQALGSVATEINGIVTLDIDHHRLQNALFAAIDGADHATRWGGVKHTGGFLVTEQDLSRLHPIADLHLHGRFHTVVIETYKRN